MRGEKELVNDAEQDANQVKIIGKIYNFFFFLWAKTSKFCKLLEPDRAAEVYQCSTPGSSLGCMGVISGKSIVNNKNYTEYQGCRRWKIGCSYIIGVEQYKPLRR